MKIIGFIPARLHSTRLPYKVLHKFDGKTMLQWVYEKASQAEGIDEIIIATDNQLVFQEAEAFGAKVVMTSSNHQSGTDRIAEAASKFSDADVYINIQGDQPFIEPQVITRLIEPYLNGLNPEMATVACPMQKVDLLNPNTVKVAVNKNRHAMFFTRSSIPFYRQQVDDAPVFQHIGLYAYTANTLKQFTGLNASKLEIAEGLEQMRALEEGLNIYVSNVESPTHEINTLEDIHQAIDSNVIDNYTLFKIND